MADTDTTPAPQEEKKQAYTKAAMLLERQGLWYIATGSPQPTRVDFPPDIVHDMELTDERQYAKLIRSFIETNNIRNTSVFILLNPQTVYTGDLGKVEATEQDEAVQAFAESVPHEYTYAKAFRSGKGLKAFVVNKDLVRIIEEEFRDTGSMVELVAPINAMEKPDQGLLASPPTESAQAILGKASVYKNYNLIDVATSSVWNMDLGGGSLQTAEKLEKTKSNTALLAGIFGLLIAVLGLVIFLNLPKKPAPAKAPATPVEAQPSAPPVAPVQTASPSASIDVSTLTITLTDAGKNPLHAKDFETQLAAEFKLPKSAITATKAASSSAGPISAIIKDNLPAEIQQRIIEGLQKVASGGASVHVGALNKSDLDITYSEK